MSGWERLSPGYLAEWLPRLLPYDQTFVEQIGLRPGDRVLSSAGSEVVALARAVGDGGVVHAIDPSEDVRHLCTERVAAAGLTTRVQVRPAAADTPYDVVASVFAEAEARPSHLTPRGKLAVMLWGPPEEDDPERLFARTLEEQPDGDGSAANILPLDRGSIGRRFEEAGLAIVRHTVVSHALVFQRAEHLARALLAARTYGQRLVGLGEERVAAVLSRFYERIGGQDRPITYSPPMTIVIAARPGAEVELPNRPSVRVPARPS